MGGRQRERKQRLEEREEGNGREREREGGEGVAKCRKVVDKREGNVKDLPKSDAAG